ncbi:unnamed protein product [Notodromas monacha]|uniref:Ribosome assembly factor mrt4 n=1 Tax=Notodromas monacha TaxID=399045 RepID=A0A7R9GAD3_9CRUS|nr:unnamed protein product [Notodromas monacha]CAG0915234.1 unnamed protein product [Notodromas monacha]
MPKGKRTRIVALTRTRKKGLDSKKKLMDDLRSCLEDYERVFVFSVRDMRNAKLKDMRTKWRTSRFFFGKNKVMAIALGRTAEEEQADGLHKLSKALRGQCGLMFTNSAKDDVVDFFGKYVEADYARAGAVATDDVALEEGPLPDFPHSVEPYLRLKLGLKTTLNRGVVTLLKPHIVCRKGERMTPEQTRLLKLMNHPMAEFRVNLVAVWSKDGVVERLNPDADGEEDEEEEGSGAEDDAEDMDSD